MTRRALPSLALLLLLGACTDVQPDKTIVTCEGTEERFVLPDLDGNPPPGTGEKVHLARIEGDKHCYPIAVFANVSQPDKCGEQHYHGDKTAIGGYIRKDTRHDGCGVATDPEVTDFIAFRLLPAAAASSPPPYGHKSGEVCKCTPTTPCCGPDVTSIPRSV